MEESFLYKMLIEWKNILLNPASTLQGMKERNLSTALVYLVIAGIITSVLGTAFVSVLGYSIAGASIIMPLMAISAVIFPVISGTLIWIIARLFGGKERLSKWLSCFISAYSPIIALALIPYFGKLVQIYGVYMTYISIKTFMKLNTRRATGVLVAWASVLFGVFVYLSLQSLTGPGTEINNVSSSAFDKSAINPPLQKMPEWMGSKTVMLDKRDIDTLQKFGMLRHMSNIQGMDTNTISGFNRDIDKYNTAIIEEDGNLCSAISFKELCYAHIGKLKNDSSLCELAGDAKSDCYEFFDNINFTFNKGINYCQTASDCALKEDYGILKEDTSCTAKELLCQSNECIRKCNTG